jgi:hypothetical protein
MPARRQRRRAVTGLVDEGDEQAEGVENAAEGGYIPDNENNHRSQHSHDERPLTE